jgi:hypothetical protein
VRIPSHWPPGPAAQHPARSVKTIRLCAATKADRMIAAEFAVKQGSWIRSETEGSVRCPLCGNRVHTVRQYVEYQLELWGTALAGAVLAHLDDTCEVVAR